MSYLAHLYRLLPLDSLVTSNIHLYRIVRGLAKRTDLLLPHESDFEAFAHLPASPGLFVDVGANDGMAARSFRLFNHNTPILAFEPNQIHAYDLARCKVRLAHFDFQPVALGDAEGEITLHTPVYKGVTLNSYTSFSEEESRRNLATYLHMPNLTQQVRFVQTCAPVRTLDSFNLEAAFVKVDVEGYEAAVLRGGLATIRRCQPIMMIENNPRSCQDVIDLLQPLGYSLWVYSIQRKQLEKFDKQAALNLFFLPT